MQNASSDNTSDAKPSFTKADLPENLLRALDVAIDKSARAPVVLNVTDITGYTDWVLIVSGRSDRHVSAVSDSINAELRGRGCKAQGTDGFGDHSWDLLDYDDFMIHVFYHPVRMHYDLESMWSDAPRVELDLPPEVTDTADLDALDTPHDLPAYRGDLVFGGFDDEFADDDDDDDLDLASAKLPDDLDDDLPESSQDEVDLPPEDDDDALPPDAGDELD
ncbi:MAG: ribosome silencing factor [Myxococcota bacterium]